MSLVFTVHIPIDMKALKSNQYHPLSSAYNVQRNLEDATPNLFYVSPAHHFYMLLNHMGGLVTTDLLPVPISVLVSFFTVINISDDNNFMGEVYLDVTYSEL